MTKQFVQKNKQMAKIILKNPYMDEEIIVKEDLQHINGELANMERGNVLFLRLEQLEPTHTMITLNPQHFAKVEYHEG